MRLGGGLRGDGAGLEDGTQMIPKIGIQSFHIYPYILNTRDLFYKGLTLQGSEIPRQALKGRIHGFGVIPVLILRDFSRRLQ